MNEQQGVPRKTYRGFEPRPLVLEASTHSIGHHAGLHPEGRPYQTRQKMPHFDDMETEQTTTRLPTSVRRYDQTATTTRIEVHRHTSIPPRRTTQDVPRQTTQDVPVSHPGYHWLVSLGIGMLVMLIGYLLLSIVLSWFQAKQDDLTYGYPRTYQTDAVVGHQDSPLHPSHFIALNLNGHILIMEVQGGDPAKVRAITGPDDVSPTGHLDPVTLQFKDVNGDGKLDMIVQIGATRSVYLNDQGTFRPLKPGEHVTL